MLRKEKMLVTVIFFLFQQCFGVMSKTNFAIDLALCHTVPTYYDPEKIAFRKYCGKRSIIRIFSFSFNVFNPTQSKLGQYSFRGSKIVIATGFILLSLLSFVSTTFKWESSQWLGKNNVWSTG